MSAGQYGIVIPRGTTFSRLFTWQDLNTNPIDLTGYKLTFTARAAADPTSPQLIQYSSPSFQLQIVNAKQGQFMVTIFAGDTATFNWSYAVYDIVASSPALPPVVTQIVTGNITITPIV